MPTRPTLVRVQEALSALAGGDFAPFAALMSDAFAWEVTGTAPWSRRYRGKAQVFEQLLRPLAARLDAPYRFHASRVIHAGPHLIIEGRGDNRLTTGVRYDNTYCWVCRFEDGALVELVEYMDSDLAMRVFGAPR